MNNLLLFIPTLIIFLVVLTLFFKTHIIIQFQKQFSISIKILFINFKIFPSNYFSVVSRKPNKKVDSKNKEYTLNLNKIIKTLKRIRTIIIPAIYTFKNILNRIKIEELHLRVGIDGEDAADISIKCTKIQIIMSNLISIITKTNNIKNLDIKIYPNFSGAEKFTDFRIDFSSRLIFIVYELLIFSFKYVKIDN